MGSKKMYHQSLGTSGQTANSPFKEERNNKKKIPKKEKKSIANIHFGITMFVCRDLPNIYLIFLLYSQVIRKRHERKEQEVLFLDIKMVITVII